MSVSSGSTLSTGSVTAKDYIGAFAQHNFAYMVPAATFVTDVMMVITQCSLYPCHERKVSTRISCRECTRKYDSDGHFYVLTLS